MIPNSPHLLSGLSPKQALSIALEEWLRRKAEQKRKSDHAAAMRQALENKKPPSLAMEGSLLFDPESPFRHLQDLSLEYIALYGGRDSAKSWSVAEHLVRRATVEPLRWLCTREYQTSVRDSVHRLLADTVHRLGLSSWFNITNTYISSRAGAEFIFKGLHNNVQEIKSTEGLDGAWIEEGQNTTKDSLDTIIPTLRKEGSRLIVTWNVTDEDAPVHQHFVIQPPPRSFVQQVNFDFNPYLSEKTRGTIEHMRATDLETFNHVYLGVPRKYSASLVLGGRYKIEAFPDDLWRKAERIFQGLDFGFANDPNAFTRSFVYRNILHIEYEAGGVGIELEDIFSMLTGTIPEAHPKPDRAREIIRKHCVAGVPPDHAAPVGKWPIKCDNARPETISFLCGQGLNASAADKWKGSVEDGITHIKSFNEIIIHPRCKETAQEARLWSYKVDRVTKEVLPVLVQKNDHYWDSVRYSFDGYIQNRGGLGVWAKLGKQ